MVVTTYLRTVRCFSRNVRLYLFVAALMGFTFDGGIHSVIFNLYLLRLGYGPEMIGLVNSAGMLAFALGAFPVGALGERWGYRRLLFAGVSTMFVGYLFLPFVEFTASAWQPSLLIATYVLMNLGVSAFFVNGIPYLMRVTAPEERNPAFAVQSALLSLAAFAGSLLAGFLPDLFAQLLNLSVDQPAPYRYPLLLAALLLMSSIWAIANTSEPAPMLTPANASYADAPREAKRTFWFYLVMLTVVRFFFVTGSAVAMTFFNVYLDAGLNVPTTYIGIAVALSRLTAVPAALITPLLAARWGNAPVSLLASIGVALFLLPMAFLPFWLAASLSYVGLIAMTSIRYPAYLVYALELLPARYQSTLAGAGETAAGLSFAVIAFTGGYLISGFGYPALFLTGTIFNGVGTLLFGLFIFFRKPTIR